MKSPSYLIPLLFVYLIISISSAYAEVTCLKISFDKRGKPRLSSKVADVFCPRGYVKVEDTSTSSVVGAIGPQGPQGIAGPQGPQGVPGSSANPSIENVQTLGLTTSRLGVNYSGQGRVTVITTPNFTKLKNDTILDITLYGLFTNPSRNSSAAIYGVTVDNTAASNGGGELLIAVGDPQSGTRYESISGLFGGIPAGTHSIIVDVRGATNSSSGTGAGFNDGGYPGNYAIIREIAIP